MRHWVRKSNGEVTSTFWSLPWSKKEPSYRRVAAACLCQQGGDGASACIINSALGRFLHVPWDFC